MREWNPQGPAFSPGSWTKPAPALVLNAELSWGNRCKIHIHSTNSDGESLCKYESSIENVFVNKFSGKRISHAHQTWMFNTFKMFGTPFFKKVFLGRIKAEETPPTGCSTIVLKTVPELYLCSPWGTGGQVKGIHFQILNFHNVFFPKTAQEHICMFWFSFSISPFTITFSHFTKVTLASSHFTS